MKIGKKLTREQKLAVSRNNLNPRDYQFVEIINPEYIKVVNKFSGIQTTIKIK